MSPRALLEPRLAVSLTKKVEVTEPIVHLTVQDDDVGPTNHNCHV